MPTIFDTKSGKFHFRMIPLWALIWFVFFLSVTKIASDRYYSEGTKAFKKYDEKLIDWLYSDEFEKHPKIVMIGNSRLRNALAAGLDSPSKLELPDGRTAAVLQFSYDVAAFTDYSDVSKIVLSRKPDILVLQTTVLTNSHKKLPFMEKLAADLSQYAFIKAQKMNIFDSWFFRRTHPVDVCFDEFADDRVANYAAFLEKSYTHSLAPSNKSYMKAREFLKEAEDKGIKVIILDIENNRALLSKAGFDPVAVDFHGIGHEPSKQEMLPDLYKRVEWLDYNAPEDIDIYCDIVHLNDAGKKHFKGWITEQLAQIL